MIGFFEGYIGIKLLLYIFIIILDFIITQLCFYSIEIKSGDVNDFRNATIFYSGFLKSQTKLKLFVVGIILFLSKIVMLTCFDLHFFLNLIIMLILFLIFGYMGDKIIPKYIKKKTIRLLSSYDEIYLNDLDDDLISKIAIILLRTGVASNYQFINNAIVYISDLGSLKTLKLFLSELEIKKLKFDLYVLFEIEFNNDLVLGELVIFYLRNKHVNVNSKLKALTYLISKSPINNSGSNIEVKSDNFITIAKSDKMIEHSILQYLHELYIHSCGNENWSYFKKIVLELIYM